MRAGGPDAFAAAVMEEIGIDISRHTPHTLRDLHDTSFDLIVTLSPEAHHQALELTRTMAVEVEYWPTFDATMMIGQRQPRADPAGLPRACATSCSGASSSASAWRAARRYSRGCRRTYRASRGYETS